QRLAGALLLLAARRYPEPVRTELALEWTGELHAIVHDDDHSRLYRDYWALLYSGSLALTAVLSSRAGATTPGAGRRKNGLTAAVILVIVVIAAAAFIRAGVAAARAHTYARAAADTRADAYAADASAAYARAYRNAFDAACADRYAFATARYYIDAAAVEFATYTNADVAVARATTRADDATARADAHAVAVTFAYA